MRTGIVIAVLIMFVGLAGVKHRSAASGTEGDCRYTRRSQIDHAGNLEAGKAGQPAAAIPVPHRARRWRQGRRPGLRAQRGAGDAG